MDGADETKRFLQTHGVPEDSVRRVWTAIALRTTPGVPRFMEPEVALVTAGAEHDVLGIGYEDISPRRTAMPSWRRTRAPASSTASWMPSRTASAPSRRRRSAT
ncbi:hypothetical protein GCM10010358_11500 [Streptomyces minutiscleroticus]|uniref:Uncharacterized protein n=1 Tax=Streptomyces minutiscleroticus TaxID=68238 RepID=A0A918KCM1_9ACTN|nr:hypothetical protein GCM10010358_11500 [Streptomyces minutiscleroticus]